MEPSRGHTLRARIALNLVLLAILAGATGAAWLLTTGQTSADAVGAEVLARVRRDGLSAHWPEGELTWCLRARGRVRAGWAASVRVRRPDGGFDGLNVVLDTPGRRSAGSWERWALDSDASSGTYTAGLFSAGTVVLLRTDTSIRLRDGEVAVRQILDGYDWNTRAPAPANYLPEGLMPLACRLAADAGGEAAFLTIFNSVPPSEHRPTFTRISMRRRPVARDDPEGSASAVLLRAQSRYVQIEETHFFDAEGRLLAFVSGPVTERRVGGTEVAGVYPQAITQLQQIMAETDMPSPNPDRREAMVLNAVRPPRR